MVVATRRGWFSSYEWVVRTNPDALVVDPGPLEKAIQASNPSMDAVLFVCTTPARRNADTYDRAHDRPMTDFFAGRPEAMNVSGWGRGTWGRWGLNAEASADLVFRATIDAGRATIWHGALTRCRVHAQGVVHNHQHCKRKPKP